MTGDLRIREGGRGEPTLLLLHGLGATGEVWDGWPSVLEARWPGRWVAPDLPGHGASAALPSYSFGGLAAAVAGVCAVDERVVVMGHSMGGVVGLALASGWFGVRVEAVVGLGVKVAWTSDEIARARALADRPIASFASRDEAAARYLRVSGLAGLLAVDDPATVAGLREVDGQWRLAQDPATFAVGVPDLPGLLGAARCPATLARGEHDAMVTDAQLAELGVVPVVLDGLGHNAHVEDPEAVIDMLRSQVS
ncbi:MAG TPA: alpha/beta hydrolase [Jiangellaceae bacterium]